VERRSLAISVYPNPVNDELHLDIEADAFDINEVSVHIFDGFGKLISTHTGVNVINTNNWLSGIYIVQIQIEQRIETLRVIKQ